MTRGAMVEVIGSRAGERLLTLLESAESRRSNLLRVLTYHRVPDPLTFEYHMRHLASRYHVTPMEALLDVLLHNRPLPPRSVMITFDDGYREVGDVAWPILRRLQLPATLFVPTAYPGRPGHTFWWDRLEQAIDDTARRDLLATPIGRLPLTRRADRVKACSRLKRYLRTLHHDDARQHGEAICRDLDAPLRPVPGILGWDDLRRLAGEGLVIGCRPKMCS